MRFTDGYSNVDTMTNLTNITNNNFSIVFDNISMYFNDGGNIPEVPAYLFIYVTVIISLVFIVGIIGNVLVIAVVCQVRAMRNSTNYFLFSLSIADLCVLLICQPVAVMDFYAKERWYIGEVMCKRNCCACLLSFFRF